jgi:hypothetical protein
MAKKEDEPTKQADKTTHAQTKQKRLTTDDKGKCNVWAECVSPQGIIVMAVYLIVLSILLIYAIFQFWPPQLPPGKVAQQVKLLGWPIDILVEMRLLAVVVLTGALGGQVHVLRSFGWFVGNRQLKMSWLVRYIVTPFVAASLALVFYLAIRAGLSTAKSGAEITGVYGYAAVAGLVGLFSDLALSSLKHLAERIFGREEGEDPVETKDDSASAASDEAGA